MNRCLVSFASTVLLWCGADMTALDDVSQTNPKEAPQVQEIKSKTELMEVRTVVTDRKGRIIEDLKKDDFELLENNRPQEISFFSVSQVESERSQPATVGSGVPGGVSGQQGIEAQSKPAAVAPGAQDKAAELQKTRKWLSEPAVRSTLLFVDTLHLSFSSLNRVKEALRRYINERLTEQDMVAVATSSQTLGISQQFTRDRQILRYAIEQIRPGPGSHENLFTPNLAAAVISGGLDGNRMVSGHLDETRLAVDLVRQATNISCCGALLSYTRSEALKTLLDDSYSRKTIVSILKNFAEQMIALPGKRMIVLFSDGFTMYDSDAGVHYEQIQPAIDRAVRSGVVIYSVDAKGLQAPPIIDASKSRSRSDQAQIGEACPGDTMNDPRCEPYSDLGLVTNILGVSEREEQNGLHAMAEQTGGQMYTDHNDLYIPLGQALDANRFYYVLSYYLPAGSDERQFRSIKVRVRNHPEYTVRTARGFSLSDTTAKLESQVGKTPQQRLIQAMGTPLPVTDLGVSALADYLETETDNKQVTLSVYFDGDRFQYQEKDQRNGVDLEILYVIYDSSGKQVEGTSAKVEGKLAQERLAQAKTSGYRFSRRLALKPGVYQANIGVREEGTDRMGTAAAWVEVPEPARNKLEMSSLMLRNPLDTDPAAAEGIHVSELEQVRMVRGIPLYARDDFCDYSFRVYRQSPASAESELMSMMELLKGGKQVRQEPWRSIAAEEKNKDSKGWFDVDGEIDLSKCDPGVYELRVSVKDARSSKTVQRAIVFGIE